VNKYSVVALALLSLSGSAVVAHAQVEGKIVVNVPFDFIAGSKTLPAGDYSVSRLSSEAKSPLIIYSRNNSVLLMPVAFDGFQPDDLQLSFEHIGDAHLLSEVKTPIGTYTISDDQDVARVTKLAQKAPARMDGMTSSGTP
jgi:hypothetical protein